MNRLILALAFVCALPLGAHAQTPRTGRPLARAPTRGAARAPSPSRTRARTRPPREPESPATARVELVRVGTNPFHFTATVSVEAPDTWTFAADHRVLAFEVTPAPAPAVDTTSRRRRRVRTLTCKHPNAGRRVDPAHVLRTPERWTEPLDIRMYCTGSAYQALVTGGSVVPVYGFRRATRTAYLARSEADPRARALASVRGEPFVPYPVTAPAAATTPAAPIVVGLVPTDSTAPNAPSLRAFIRGTVTARVYLRDDLFAFRITDPSGRLSTCAPPRTTVVPIVDFYKRVTPGARLESVIDASRYCRGVFSAPGIYEITPEVELPYGGERFGIEAVTGRYTGEPSFVRVRPNRGAYVPLGT